MASSANRRSSVGLIVNPIAGLGGRVGLKGTDGPGTADRARELGAVPEASHRASLALRSLRSDWPPRVPFPDLTVAAGPMGADAGREAAFDFSSWGCDVRVETTAEDTRLAAASALAAGVDLLLFAGGDGTARDIASVIGDRITALGIPAGVKVGSAVFATGPAAAGRIAAGYLATEARRTDEREVLDLDEDAYRRGEVTPSLCGYLRVPLARHVQGRKAPSPPGETEARLGIAARIVEEIDRDTLYVLGPGTTVRSIADRMGVPKTLIGIDVMAATSPPRLIAADAGERQLLALLATRPSRLVVTPIGGQGFLFGRGNQPISSLVIRASGLERMIVVATPGKLAALGGRPLLVDTGDAELDAELEGHVKVITGYRDSAVVAVAAA